MDVTIMGHTYKVATEPLKALGRMLTGKKDESVREFRLVNECSGVLRPGTITLLMAPPGHGKTSFLRALAGRRDPGRVVGKVTYNGKTKEELLASGVHLNQLANYCDQLDTHLPFLTVRETFAFAAVNSTVDPAVYGNPVLKEWAENRVQGMIDML